MNFTFHYLFVLVQICYVISDQPDKKCFNNYEEQIHYHMATATPYRTIKNVNVEQIRYEGCEPQKLWAIIRHGSRYPSRKKIRLMQTYLPKLQQQIQTSTDHQLCSDDLVELRNWKPQQIDETEEKFLVDEGMDELFSLAERMQYRFPTLFKDVYDSDWYRFKFTKTQRTERSFEAFTIGLFGRNNTDGIQYDKAVKKDRILRFYKDCPRWKKEVDKNPDSYREVNRWAASEDIKQAVERISKTSGQSNLTVNDVHLIYSICAFESAWNKENLSPWCRLFDAESIRAFEFLEDLEYYHIDGYGNELTYKQACPTVTDMLNRINSTTDGPKVTVYFTHSGTMLKLLAHFGLYKDNNTLTHEDYRKDRKWRLSKIDAFASNLAFINFKCQDKDYVLAMHQEKVVHMPGCPLNTDLCQYDQYLQMLDQSNDEKCRFEEMCRLPTSDNSKNNDEL